MSDAAHSLPLAQPGDNDSEIEAERAQAGKAGGGGPVKWKVVARVPGLLPAQVIAGRLQAEGIPTRAWQESAGQALGLTVGLLGTGYVAVPEQHEARAQMLLDKE